MGLAASAPSAVATASSACNAQEADINISQSLPAPSSPCPKAPPPPPPPPSVVAVTFEYRQRRAFVALPASAARGDAPLLGTAFFRAYFPSIPADEVRYRVLAFENCLLQLSSRTLIQIGLQRLRVAGGGGRAHRRHERRDSDRHAAYVSASAISSESVRPFGVCSPPRCVISLWHGIVV